MCGCTFGLEYGKDCGLNEALHGFGRNCSYVYRLFCEIFWYKISAKEAEISLNFANVILTFSVKKKIFQKHENVKKIKM